MRSIKKAQTYIFTHLFERIEETKKKKIHQHGTRKVSLFNYLSSLAIYLSISTKTNCVGAMVNDFDTVNTALENL